MRDVAGHAARSFSFGPFVLVPEQQLLLQDDAPVRIGGRALDILSVLVERPGELVSKRELMARVWSTTVVEEANLKVNMTALRRALGDDAGSSKYIATVSGRGYRFIASVGTGESAGFAPPSGATMVSHNLPIVTAKIFGRSDTIATLMQDLGDTRLVSIVGPGGVGKTTVALAVAERSVAAFKDGVWLIDLTLLHEPALMANAIATAIGLALHSADMLGALCELMRDREALLVLDNCEHMLDASAACVDRILKATTGVKILVTSREPLRLAGERVHRLQGLLAPPEASSPSAEHALTFPAIELFVDRARSSFELFRFGDADVQAVTEICRRLDGLALAIELAASRIEAFGVVGVMTQLDDRFRLLSGRRAGPVRQRTMAATLDWSYGLLSADEAALLRAVSVFPNFFDAEGAAVAADIAAVDASEFLAQLAAKSLVASNFDGDHVLFRMLESTRSYCAERLAASGDEADVRRRHAQRVCDLLDQAAREWEERPAGEWGAAYRRVLDDLRSALAWASQDAQDRLLLIRLTVAGTLLWDHFSLTEECRRHVLRAIEELDAAGLGSSSVEMQLQASLAGTTQFARGMLPEVAVSLKRAMDIATQLGNTDVLLRCLRMMTSYRLFLGQQAAAGLAIDEFTALATAAEPAAVANGEAHRGLVEIFDGRIAQARQRLEKRFQLDLQDLDDRRLARFQYDRKVDVGNVLSNAQWLTGSPDTAMHVVEATVERAFRTTHNLSLSNALAVAACPVSFLCGHHEQSARYVAMLVDQVARHGFVAWRPIALFYRAALACVQSDYEVADVDAMQKALEEFRAIHHLVRMPFYLGVLADAFARSGRLSQAEETIRSAIALADAQTERWCGPELWRIAASISFAQGKVVQAEVSLFRSIALAREMGTLSWLLRAVTDLAQLWRRTARSRDGRALLQATCDDFSEGFATRDLRAAASVLATLDA